MRQIAVIILGVLSLLAVSVSAEIWQDDFERDGLGEDWTIFKRFNNAPESDWKIEDGVAKGHWPFWGCQLAVVEEYPSLNYTIQVDCRIDKMGAFTFACIGFRVSKPDFCPSFYGFGISSSHAGFVGDPGCDVTSVAGAAIPRIHKVEQWYTVRLVVKGNKFSGYVDDSKACRLADGRYKGGFVGLITGPNTDASFDNFMITDRVDDDAFTDFGVSPEDMLATTWAGLKTK